MTKLDPDTKHLDSVLDEIENCAKCGACRSVCPVFAEYGLEKKTARGKVAVCQAIADRTLSLTEDLHNILEDCLLCLTCVENCSRDVQTHKIIKAARAALLQKRRDTDPNPDISSTDLPIGISENNGLKYYFLRKSNEPGKPDLPIVDIPFIKWNDVVLEARNAVRTVHFFTGCFINHAYPAIGEALVSVLNAVGVTVKLETEPTCCGAPMAAAGDMERVRALAKNNIQALDGNHPVVVACASGGRMLKFDYPELFDPDDPWRDKAEALAARTYDISEFLVDEVGVEVIASKIRKKFPHTLTYHDPCQLNRGQQVKDAPRKLLHTSCGNNFIESRQSDRCCGAGTIYGIFNPETSQKIRSHKIEDILQTGAQTVATGCPACIKQLSEGFLSKDSPIEVLHTIQIIARAMGLSEA